METIKKKYNKEAEELFAKYNPYESNAIHSHNIGAMTRYARKNGKKVSELSKEDVEQFRLFQNDNRNII